MTSVKLPVDWTRVSYWLEREAAAIELCAERWNPQRMTMIWVRGLALRAVPVNMLSKWTVPREVIQFLVFLQIGIYGNTKNRVLRYQFVVPLSHPDKRFPTMTSYSCVQRLQRWRQFDSERFWLYWLHPWQITGGIYQGTQPCATRASNQLSQILFVDF